MNCPNCSRNRARVVDTRPIKRGRERRRRYLCRGCGHRFTEWARFNEATRGDKDLARIKELLVDIQDRIGSF